MPKSKTINNSLDHDSAYLHVTGKAKYVADIPKSNDTPPIKNVKAGSTNINPNAIKKTGICFPSFSCSFFA